MADQLEGGRERLLQVVESQIRLSRRQERSEPPNLPPVLSGVPREEAPGVEFRPTDVELVVFYLRRYVSGQPLPKGVVVPVDVYGTEPWNLLQEGKEEAYFFARRTKRSANSRWPSRKAGEGSWQTFKGEEKVKSAADGLGEVTVGIKNSLSFKHGALKYSGWVMYEYELVDPGDRRETFQEHVLCHIKRTRVGKNRGKKRELPTPTVSYAVVDGDMTDSSSCKDDPGVHMMPLLKKMRGSSSGVDHAAETSWTSSYIFSRAGGIGQVDSSMLPEVAADRMSNYSTGETATMPLLLQERQVKMSLSSSSMMATGAAAEAEVESKEQDTFRNMSFLQPISEEQDASKSILPPSSDEHDISESLLQPLSEEQQQPHGGDHELFLIMDRSSITIDDLFIPDLGWEEDGELDLAALDDIPLWS